MMPPTRSDEISRFLVFAQDEADLAPAMVGRIQAAISDTDQPFDLVVTELGLIEETKLARLLADFMKLDFVPAPASSIDDPAMERLGHSFVFRHGLTILKTPPSNALHACMSDPFSGQAIQLAQLALDRPLGLVISTRTAISDALTASYPVDSPNKDMDWGQRSAESHEVDLERLRDLAQDAPVVRLISRTIREAVEKGATDIHFEPTDQMLRTRMRIDGLLTVTDTAPLSMAGGIATRLKILAGLNIAERRLPQDGRMHASVHGIEVDMRLSVVPSLVGETIVLRILDRSQVHLDLADLGFAPDACEMLHLFGKLSNGIILATGPTGSGKTTTLYAILKELVSPAIKILTVEDPVEYRLPGITQVQVDPSIDLTFSRTLRSALRHDPDIILIGEIRDRETADIAMRAALTGHLVLATLHASSAVGTITRLRDMGIEDYLIGAAVKGVVSQRLLRRTCRACGGQRESACAVCSGCGYSGRTVAFEILRIDAALGQEISRGMLEDSVAAHAQAQGMVPIREQALSLVKDDVTQPEEIARVLQSDD